MNRIILLFIIIIISSCKKENPSLPNISAELQPYINRFYNEAENRGIFLDKNIDALITSDIESCGKGNSSNQMFDKPTILINEACWSPENEVFNEMLVFHELGHALLIRPHIDGVLPNGHSKSIMCSGNDFSCSPLPNYDYCPEYREYYIDELFDQSTSPPQWSTRSWDELAKIHSDLNSSFIDDWKIYTNCSPNNYQVTIDSISPNRPSLYSLRLFSNCNESISIRRRIAIENSLSADAIRLNCDLYHNLEGDGFQVNLFVKNTDNNFSSFNRSLPKAIVDSDNTIDNFNLQAECLSTDADSLSISFQFLENTFGEIFIGNLDILLME